MTSLYPSHRHRDFIFTFTYSLVAWVVGAPRMTSQPVSSISFFFSPLPSGTWRTPGLSIPWCCLPIFFLSALSSSPFHCALQGGFWPGLRNGRRPNHFSLRLLTMIRRSSCDPIACWISVRSSSLVTWSLYEMRSICSSISFPEKKTSPINSWWWTSPLRLFFFFFAFRLASKISYQDVNRRKWKGNNSVDVFLT